MLITKVNLHLLSRWTHYTDVQRHVVCALLDLDEKATLNAVLAKMMVVEDNHTVQSLLTLMRTFTPSALLSDIESGQAPQAPIELTTPTLAPEPKYRVAAIRITEEEVKTFKTLLYVPEDVHRFVTRQDSDHWTSSKGVHILFQKKLFDYRIVSDEVYIYLPLKCTTQVVCLEDEVERPELQWEWNVVCEALTELTEQVRVAEVKVKTMRLPDDPAPTGPRPMWDGSGIRWKIEIDPQSNSMQQKVELYLSKAALLFIYHQTDCRWTADNGVVLYCPGDTEPTITGAYIRLDGRRGDGDRFMFPSDQWKKSKWTPQQVRDALAELSQAVRKSNQSTDLSNMETF